MDLKNVRLEGCNMKNREHYLVLADIFRYPEEDFLAKLEVCMKVLEQKYPDAARELKRFSDYVNGSTPDRREELYTKSFDVQPICYLDLGYVIFGEDYKRGAFLLHMQEEQRVAGNDCGTDLPDHLTNMLVLLSITEKQELMLELASSILIPGLKKMISEFSQARVDLKQQVLKKLHKVLIDDELNSGNVYRNALEALLIVVQTDFPEDVVYQQDSVEGHHIPSSESFFRKRSEIPLEPNFKLD